MCVLTQPPHRRAPVDDYVFRIGLSGRRRDWYRHPEGAASWPRILVLEVNFAAPASRSARLTALRLICRVLPGYSWEAVGLGRRRVET